MKLFHFLRQSLLYHKTANVSLFFAIAFTTAIVTGALTIGDTVEYSLKTLVNKRLGNATQILQTGERYISKQTAQQLSKNINNSTTAVFHTGGMINAPSGNFRANQVEVYGIDSAFFKFSDSEQTVSVPGKDELYVNQKLADKLQVKAGEQVILKVAQNSLIPQNSPFADDTRQYTTLRLTVTKILQTSEFGDFSLRTDQKTPYNAFLNYDYLTKKMEMQDWANILLVNTLKTSEQLDSLLNKQMKLRDYTLTSSVNTKDSSLQIKSSRIFLDYAVSDAALKFPNSEKCIHYLANNINYQDKKTPYSFVAARDISIDNNQAIINQWLADDLQLSTGDSLTISYFTIGALRQLQEQEHKLQVVGIKPTESNLFDASLMPNYPGINEAGNCRDWQTGIPIDFEKIRDKDEKFWDKYKGSPKLLVNLNTGKKLWNNQFGSYTSIRIPLNNQSPEVIENKLLKQLQPHQFGLFFKDVKHEAMYAAENGVDFGQLFISLSFFVIVAGLILSGLILRLNLNNTRTELGTLRSMGFTQKRLFQIKFYEILILSIPANILGVLLGLAYNYLMTVNLNTIWSDAVKTSGLNPHFTVLSLIIGFASGLILSLIVLVITLRKHLKTTIHNLLKQSQIVTKKPKYYLIAAVILFVISIALISYSLITHKHESTMLFLSSGGSMLMALSGLIYYYLQTDKNILRDFTKRKLIINNLSYKPLQSMAIILLMALGIFTVVVTGANRKTFYGQEQQRTSGTGGFTYWGESSIPIIYDINTPQGKEKLNLTGEPSLDSMEAVSMLRVKGDDASCLNLNKIESPKILGINTSDLMNPTAFSFSNLAEAANNESPWKTLDKPLDNNVYPAFADQTVITWGLIKEVGDTLTYTDEFGTQIHFVLMGGLGASVFQGHLLVNRSVIQQHFPSISGAEVFLINVPEQQQLEARKTLEYLLADYGVNFEKTSDRLAEFNSITNTYLAIFMILGGLGVLVGTLGMGIIIVRNINERKHEFAYLLAAGYKKSRIFMLVFSENSILLISALFVGVLGAVIGILPSLLSASFAGSFRQILYLLVIIMLNGLFWIFIASRNSINSKLLENLKND